MSVKIKSVKLMSVNNKVRKINIGKFQYLYIMKLVAMNQKQHSKMLNLK